MKSFINTNILRIALAFGIASPIFAQVPDLTKDAQSVDRQRTNHLVAPGDFVWNSSVTGNWSDAAKWTKGQSDIRIEGLRKSDLFDENEKVK